MYVLPVGVWGGLARRLEWDIDRLAGRWELYISVLLFRLFSSVNDTHYLLFLTSYSQSL